MEMILSILTSTYFPISGHFDIMFLLQKAGFEGIQAQLPTKKYHVVFVATDFALGEIFSH